jgi:hypothetical protein
MRSRSRGPAAEVGPPSCRAASKELAVNGTELLAERARLQRLVEGYQWSQVLSTAVRVGLVDAIAAAPVTAAALARQLGLHETAVERLLRALAVQGLVTATGDGSFGATASLSLLRTGAPDSLADVAREASMMSRALASFDATVSSGASAFQATFGQPLFRYLRDHPDEAAAFDGTMTALSGAVVSSFVATYPFDDVVRVVDVGGGVGHLGAAVAAAHRHLEMVVFDRDRVEASATEVLAQSEGRCSFQAGNFFTALPGGADCHLLKWVLHDWGDEHCIQILGNCRDALAPDGTIVIIERLLPTHTERDPAAEDAVLYDLMMLAIGGAGDARERTLDGYDALLDAAGLKRIGVLPLVEGFVALTATRSVSQRVS